MGRDTGPPLLCSEESSAASHEVSPPDTSDKQTRPKRNYGDLRWITAGGIHQDLLNRPRKFLPQSLFRFLHEDLHLCIADSFCVRIWLLPAAFVLVTVALFTPLAPFIVCTRFFYLACFGTLADVGNLSWYAPIPALLFAYLFALEIALFFAWVYFRDRDTEQFGPTYPFPVLYMCLRMIDGWIMWLLRLSGCSSRAGVPS